ncbi:MAG TPA: flagellar biosynthetic protein FliO [Deltaproteobacteria bacterium]|jgi:flagellar biosynthetic protein FliO|nr:flagellar biosynthetic protein FliO [Deltaproteobacteria bacterium]HOI07490.1 flagellar biosynthetic protein FliO [Deltaproteobacteria bacterium]
MKPLKLGIALAVALLLTAADACAGETGPAAIGFRTFAVLIGTVCALFALAWAARKYGPYARVKRGLGLSLIGQIPVGPRAHLTLVRVGRSVLLLGVTQNQVSLIKDLEGSDFDAVFTQAENKGGAV